MAEALAVGVPVITTEGAPWADLNTTNCGWWINLSLVNLKRSLEQVMECSPTQIKKMGDNGQRLIKEKYDIKGVAKKITELYKKILEK